MSILGQPQEIFDAYEFNVRREYVPPYSDPEFEAGRTVFIKAFLKKDIFWTDIFRGKYEKSAKENLRRSLANLNH